MSWVASASIGHTARSSGRSTRRYRSSFSVILVVGALFDGEVEPPGRLAGVVAGHRS